MSATSLCHSHSPASLFQDLRGRPEAAMLGPPPAYGVLPLKEAVQELDLGEEVMETVLSYLQV